MVPFRGKGNIDLPVPIVERKVSGLEPRAIFAAVMCYTVGSSKYVETLSLLIMGKGPNLCWSILLVGSEGKWHSRPRTGAEFS
jgi:hypothetical protein